LDGNLYAAGRSWGAGTDADFTVLSLTSTGDERWLYRYNGPANDLDEAYSIAAGPDSNLYAAGYSDGGPTHRDLVVVSLTASGAERWVYRYDGPVNYEDYALSIVVGSDGNIYAAGYSDGSGNGGDLTVVSLTASGAERWVYRYNGPADTTDWAESIIMGSDGNLYAAGYSDGSGNGGDFTVVSLTASGAERWVYQYDGPGDWADIAYSIVMGPDGNIYAAGVSDGGGTFFDWAVLSLSDVGVERWVYRYSGSGNYWDRAKSIAVGPDGNLYAAGSIYRDGTADDLTVVSLSPGGAERWTYIYERPGESDDWANSIVSGSDGNLYVAGRSWSGTLGDFTVVALTPTGAERWVYRYNGPGSSEDYALSIVTASDGNLYVAGGSDGAGTNDDFTVVSLAPDVGVAEGLNRPQISDSRLSQNSPNPFHHSTLISYSLPAATEVTLAIYDITGWLVETLVNETRQPGIHQVRWDRKTNPSGVYFYRLRAGQFVETRKMVVVE
jgi:uncharacterized delta-60 repeat protein